MMRAVAHMDRQPLGQGGIAERGMLHEQIVPASRQELVRQRDKARHAVPQLPLHHARIGTLGRLRGRRGTTARGNPPDIEIHELAEPLSQWPRPASTTAPPIRVRSEEHTSELQSLAYLVCRLLL